MSILETNVVKVWDTITDKTYYGKTQRYLKERTGEHLTDVEGRRSQRNNKNQQYARADAFAKHFANYCQDCTTSNQVKQRLKPIIKPKLSGKGAESNVWNLRELENVLSAWWKGSKLSTVSARTNTKSLNTSDIYSPCKCSSKFHKFKHDSTMALRTRLTQNEVTPNKRSKKKNRKHSKLATPNASSSKPVTPESGELFPESPPELIDTNVPWAPYRTPCANPPRLHLEQRKEWDRHVASNLDFEPEVEI